MKNAEKKLRYLVVSEMRDSDDPSATIDRILTYIDPSDLVEFGYSEELKEYMKDYEMEISDSLRDEILSALNQATKGE